MNPKFQHFILAVLFSLPSSVSAQQYMVGGKPVSQPFAEGMGLVNKANSYIEESRFLEALETAQHAVQLAPESALTHAVLGAAEARTGDSDSAIEEYKKAIAIEGDHPELWYSLASVYQSDGKTVEAVETFKEFLKKFPNHERSPLVRSNLAILERELKNRSGSASANSEDYFVDATKSGVLKWSTKRMPLRVCIIPGTNVAGFEPSYEQVAKDAFNSWAQASGGKVTFEFVEEQTDADIKLRWSANRKNVLQPAEGGEAKVLPGSDGISKVSIVALTVMPVKDIRVDDKLMSFICLHEIGHSLGIIGHSSNVRDIMYCSLPLHLEKSLISERDTKTLQHLYSDSVPCRKLPGASAGFIPTCQDEMDLDLAAKKKYSDGHIDEAIKLYREGCVQYPSSNLLITDFSVLLNNAGVAAMNNHDFYKALSLFDEAKRLKPADKNILLNQGLCHMNIGLQQSIDHQFTTAEASYKTALELLSTANNKSCFSMAVKNYQQFLINQGRGTEAKQLDCKYSN